MIIEWIMEYHQSILALEIPHQRIDDFITAHKEQEEQVVSTLETPKVGFSNQTA